VSYEEEDTCVRVLHTRYRLAILRLGLYVHTYVCRCHTHTTPIQTTRGGTHPPAGRGSGGAADASVVELVESVCEAMEPPGLRALTMVCVVCTCVRVCV
jgi:hypothetical protein